MNEHKSWFLFENLTLVSGGRWNLEAKFTEWLSEIGKSEYPRNKNATPFQEVLCHLELDTEGLERWLNA